MNTTIAILRLNRIDFQIDQTNILLTCFLENEKKQYQQSYYISHREMNIIIGNLQSLNSEICIYEQFSTIQLNENEILYSLDFSVNELKNNYLPRYESFHLSDVVKEIRA